jgi:large subunit ribosomal protein L10
MANLINKLITKELSDAFGSAEGMVICSVKGLTVPETEGLRDSLAEHGVGLRMVRNRLAKRALAETGIEVPGDMLVGNIVCAWGSPDDTINAAKVLHRSPAHKVGKIQFKGGFFEGELLDAKGATSLAQLPGRDEVHGQMVSLISGPARSLVGLLSAPGGSLVRVVQAHVDA